MPVILFRNLISKRDCEHQIKVFNLKVSLVDIFAYDFDENVIVAYLLANHFI